MRHRTTLRIAGGLLMVLGMVMLILFFIADRPRPGGAVAVGSSLIAIGAVMQGRARRMPPGP